MSDDSIPSPPEGQHQAPPAPPTPPASASGAPAQPSVPPAQAYAPPAPPTPPFAASALTQAYPGAVPSFDPAAPASPYGATQPYGGAPSYGGATAYGSPYAPPRPASGLAITSLVCGIAGVVFGTFLFWLVLPFLSSVVAIITGHLALRRSKADPRIGGRGLAFGGLITGYAMVAIQLVVLAFVLFGFLFVGAFSLPFIFSA